MKQVIIILTIAILTSIGILFIISSIGLSFFPLFTSPLAQIMQPSPEPLLTNELILAGINRVRLINNASVLTLEDSLCPLANSILNGEELNGKKVKSICPNCTEVITVSFDKKTSLQTAIQYIEADATASATINNKKLNISCLVDSEAQIVLVAANKSTPPSPKPVRQITEDELFKALMEYRTTHGASQLSKDEKLCTYAQKRITDHQNIIKNKIPKEAYPVQEKYPLDAHDGFKKDAESGYVFEVTEKNQIAENLAYWPNAQYGTHVIEWGWDSSTEGHRETQLSNDFNSVCLSGQDGFFVAIFGK